MQQQQPWEKNQKKIIFLLNWFQSYAYILYVFTAFSRRFYPKRLRVINTCIHTLMAVAAMQGADQHIGNDLEVGYLAQGRFDMKTGGKNQRPLK